MTQPEIPKFNLNPPNDGWSGDKLQEWELGAFRDITIDLFTIAYRKYSVDWFRRKRKHRKLYKFFIKLNK